MTKRTCAFGMLAALVAVTACVEPEAGPASVDPALRARTFNSKVAFDVYVRKTPDDAPELIGRTPSDKPLKIPAGASWWVEPVWSTDTDMDMARVRAEIQARRVPGLRLMGLPDDELVHLKGLTRLEMLNLGSPYVQSVTDAGLVHLKGLTGLRTLDLS
ncbi:MAG: hypothetical protein HQ546_11045, partial [Planctomycetes bacterium]|nr:hypothetical protein [Planctomycetota bacterium]